MQIAIEIHRKAGTRRHPVASEQTRGRNHRSAIDKDSVESEIKERQGCGLDYG